ncbi:hypothetical protein B0H10DRAFT_2159542 [Mycena sp. CBHHK59/15]|nr:hypothetical protein B0H10DRAFT_2159542 [Mycena sp. CBHHK59/15]
MESRRRPSQLKQGSPYEPFLDDEEWDLAIWLSKNVSQTAMESYLNKNVDQLPMGPSWKCENVMVAGNLLDKNDQMMSEDLELWKHEHVECIKEILVVILSSNKTQLTRHQGDKAAWLVYLMIRNISKDIRCQLSAHTMVLIGYLPVSKLTCFMDATHSLAGYCLFHHCMSLFLKPLVRAGENGVEVVCINGFIWRVHPILAVYESRCPCCLVPHNKRGEHPDSLLQDVDNTLSTLDDHQRGAKPSKFEDGGLCAVYRLFWCDLPYTDIFTCFTHDLLCQLHQGIFKDHLAMHSHAGLWHFKKRISLVSQWMGTEHKEMQCIFLGVLAGTVDMKVLTVVKLLIDFIYYSRFHNTFHANEDILIKHGICEHFNIPKLNVLQHYVDTIRALGSADGYNTEALECLHIDFAKDTYHSTNKHDYMEQITRWL